MVTITKRQRSLIALLPAAGVQTASALALALGVSERTIQSEIRALNKKVPGLVVSSNRGYTLSQDIYFASLADMAFEQDFDLDSEVLQKLLVLREPINIDELADSLYISTPTLSKSIKSLNSMLTSSKLSIERTRNMVSLAGKEHDKRALIRKMLTQEADPSFTNLENLDRYLGDIDVERIATITEHALAAHGHTTDDPYYSTLLMNISIALWRMKFDHYLVDDTYEIAKTSDEWLIAAQICNSYAEHWGLKPQGADISYIASLLVGQTRKEGVETGSGSAPMDEHFLEELDGILRQTFESFGLTINTESALYGFALHIDSLIKRSRQGQPAENLLLPSLKSDVPYIYDIACIIAAKLEECFGISIPDDEIGFICVHVGFMVQESLHDAAKVQIAVCENHYHGIDEKLRSRLAVLYQDTAEVFIINPNLAYQLNDPKIDLIVSTKELANNPKVLCISPFYTADDDRALKGRITQLIEEKRSSQIMGLIENAFHEKLFVRLKEPANKGTVIRQLSALLLEQGIVDEGFCESVFERERLSSTCFFDLFAIPHGTELNAERTMFCVAVGEVGITWDTSTIHLVMMIAVAKEDRADFMQLYNGIVQVLEKPEKVARLTAARTLDEFVATLRSQL